MTFRAAVLQMRSVDREYEINIKTIIKYMSEAKQNGADILYKQGTKFQILWIGLLLRHL